MRVGVDFGGTSIKAATVADGTVRRFERVATNPGAGPAAILDALAAAVRALGAAPEVAGVAIPGEVNDSGLCWRLPNVPGFENYPLRAELEQRLGCPVALENDATAAALAERLFGWGLTHRSFLLVTLGTGVGGGLVLDGNLRRGRGGFAGEIGHIMVDSTPGAWPCGCGRNGCLEAYAGTRGLLRKHRELGGQATDVAAAVAGPTGDALLEFLGHVLGTALAGLNNALDLDAIVFSGGVSNSFSRFEPALRAALAARSYAPQLANLPLLLSQLGEHAGVIGAAMLPGPAPGASGRSWK